MGRHARTDNATRRLVPVRSVQKRAVEKRPVRPSRRDTGLTAARPQLRIGMILAVVASAAALWWVVSQSTYDADAVADPLILASHAATTVPTLSGEPVESFTGPARTATRSPSRPATTRAPTAGSTATRPAPTDPAEPGAPQSTSWLEVLHALDVERSAAFRAGDPALLARVYAPGSAPLARDAEILAELGSQHLRAVDLVLQIEQVTALSVDVERATLRVVDRLAPYRLIDPTGATVQTLPGRAAAGWLVTLAAGPDGWRISEIVRE